LQAHVVPVEVDVHCAVDAQPPLLTAHDPAPVQVVPLPVYPVVHTHVFVPGPVLVHVAFASHPPWLTLHELIAAHAVPVPE
jgi:hypothetical protein